MDHRVDANVRSDRVMTATEAAYFAGILDGEGSIFLLARKGRRRSHYFSAGVAVGNTNLGMLRWIAERTGNGRITKVHIRRYENQKQGYLWTLTPRQVAHVLPQALPYLVAKRRQAEIALRYLEIQWCRGAGRVHSSDIPEVLALYAEIRELNRPGLKEREKLEFELNGEDRWSPKRICLFEGCEQRAYRREAFCYTHWVRKRDPIEKKCEQCGADMLAMVSKKRFCSAACGHRSIYLRRRALTIKPREIRTCPICKAEFEWTGGKKKHCSARCAAVTCRLRAKQKLLDSQS